MGENTAVDPQPGMEHENKPPEWAALDAAKRVAVEKADELHPYANVLVVAVTASAREVTDGFYPGGRHQI